MGAEKERLAAALVSEETQARRLTSDKDNTVLSYLRKDGDKFVIVVLNFTPGPRSGYRIGVPRSGRYGEKLSSGDERFGGSGATDSLPPAAVGVWLRPSG